MGGEHSARALAKADGVLAVRHLPLERDGISVLKELALDPRGKVDEARSCFWEKRLKKIKKRKPNEKRVERRRRERER